MDRVCLVSHHHSDLVWKRTAAGYRKIREKQILQVFQFLRKYPYYNFTLAQTPEVECFLKDHPELEGEFKSYVQSGRIGLVCGMVSISDTNLVLGESIVRNILSGCQYYDQKFSKEIKVAWFMDAFGMSGQIPQILVKSGFKYLLPGRCPGLTPEATDKGFIWEGLDGSRMLTAVGGENAVQTVGHVCNLPVVWQKEERMRYSLEKLKDVSGDVFAFYYTEEELLDEKIFAMVEEVNRLGGKTIVFSQPEAYYQRLAGRKDTLPVVKGEFNPEFTGCYTTRISYKQMNRRAEELLLSAEKTASLAFLFVGKSYPFLKLQKIWEKLNFLQFHDGICGCHSDEVYQEAKKDFQKIISESQKITRDNLSSLAKGVEIKDKSLIVFNLLNWNRKGLVSVKSKLGLEIRNIKGEAIFTQKKEGELFFIAEVPAFGYTVYTCKPKDVPESSCSTIHDAKLLADYKFETKKYRVYLKDGKVIIKDKETKDSIFPKENFCQIQFRGDIGGLWTESYQGCISGEEEGSFSIKEVIKGPVFTEVVITGEIKNKDNRFWKGFKRLKWQKKIVFYQDLAEIDVEIALDWQGCDTKILLTFPLDINPFQARATHEIPYGSIVRKPYFEVPASQEVLCQKMSSAVLSLAKGDWPVLRWVSYGEERKGVVLANQGTPGHCIDNQKISVSLLRSGTELQSGLKPPVDSFENGQHLYAFRLKPYHNSSVEEGYKVGLEFNSPLAALKEGPHPGKLPAQKTLIDMEAEGIVCSAVKMDNKKEGFIVRLYETRGRAQELDLNPFFPCQKMVETDLMEREEKIVSDAHLSFSPFEIKTIKVT